MSGRIPENILEDILSRVDIVELIAGYIPLKRAGRNFKTNCPFHHEKTPSFMVSPDRQIYHCFGCGESGNAFKFLMRYERMEFPEAVETLAKKAGVVLPQTTNNGHQAASISTQIYKINELAASFYENNLNSREGVTARDYLLKRGITQKSVKLFKLGFAPDRRDTLINHLRAKNIPLGLLEKAGLILAKQGGGYYDRFRNRIIFAIFDIKSRIVGFGARALPSSQDSGGNASLAKYVNSPETSVYVKGKNLYGLNFAKDSIRQNDYAVVVEGYLDCIIPYQEGLQNVAASQGTAFTEEQARLLKRYTANVMVVYDGDKAGEIAALRALDIFIEEGISVKVVSLPGGFDPDSFVRKNGIDKFREKVEAAEDLFDYKLKVLKSRYDIKKIEDKAKVASQMLVTVNKFRHAVLKSEYIKRLAEELSVKEDALLEELNKFKDSRVSHHSEKTPARKPININPTEKLLIKLMLQESELVKHIQQHLQPSDFQDEMTSRIISTMFELASQGKTIDRGILMSHFGDEDISQVICESVFTPEISEEHKEKIISDCIQRLKTEKVKLKRQRLHEQIKLAQHLGDDKKLNILMQEFHLLIKKG